MFIGTLRAILDSKYNDFLIHEYYPKQISAFPDFLYGWFNKFTLDISSRVIRELNQKEKALIEDTRMNFFMDLLHPKLS